jgi:hypothetical protein
MTMRPRLQADARRRALMLGLPSLLLGCGGGGGGDSPPEPPPLEGTLDARTLRVSGTGVSYPLRLYLPPASAGPRSALPVLYVLDGETWFDTVVRAAEATRTRALVVGINSASRRDLDLVPPNTCTAGGGGQAAFLRVVREEMLPFVQAEFGGDASQRALFGHSHGGGFVLFAMLADTPGRHAFRHYLACDASLGCYYDTAIGWLDAYAAAQRTLPVRLMLSHASQGNVLSNVPWAEALAARRLEGLDFRAQAYTGSHGGIVPQAVSDGLTWLRAAG